MGGNGSSGGDSNGTAPSAEQNGSVDDNGSTPVVDNNQTKTKGYLIDSALQGVTYVCEGKEALTDVNGMFECVEAPVTFKIGELTLGTLNAFTADGKVYLQDLLGVKRDTYSDEKLKLLARLVQSLDDDGNIATTITITQKVRDAVTKKQNFDSMTEREVRLLVEGIGKRFVEECEAVEHLGDSSVSCGSDGGYYVSGNTQTSTANQNTTITGYVIDDPIQNANITIFSEDGKTIIGSTKSNVDGSFSIEKPKSSNSKFYILTAKDGTIKGEAFKGSMTRICFVDDIKSCNITPYTTLLTQLSGQFNGETLSRLEKASNEVKTILNLEKDPFITNLSSVDLSLWRNALSNGLGLSDMIASLQSDLSDGYIDDESLKKIFTNAKFRVEKTVTENDFTIDKTVKTPIEKDDNVSLEHLTLPKDTIVTREIYSMSKGEKGTVTTKGYLSDIAYVETQDYSKVSGDANDSIERVIYQSFNVAEWSGKLNAETTILSKVFMAEPTLLFLPNSEKERVADILLKDDAFVQANKEYIKIINYSVDASEELFDNLIINLSNIGKEKLGNSQIINSSNILTFKLNKVSFKQNRKIEKLATATDPFQAFDGMWLGYDKTSKKLKTYSRSSLWYGLQSESNFQKDNFFQSWSTTSLISPKVGLVSKEDVTYVKDEVKYGAVTTEIDLKDVSKNINSGVTINLYRNNPNSYVDVPQVMNTISFMQILLESAVGIRGVTPKKVSKAIEKVAKKASSFQKDYADTAKILFAIADIGLTVKEITCHENDTACQQGTKNVQKVLTQIDNIFNFSSGNSDKEQTIVQNEYKKIAKEVMKNVQFSLAHSKKKIKIKIDLSILKPVILSKLIIEPASKFAGTDMKDYEAYELARDLFTKKRVDAKKRFLKIWSKAVKKGFNAKKLLIFTKSAQNGFKSILSLNNIKDSFSKISIKEISTEVMKSLLESGSSMAVDQLYNIVKSFTPAKVVDFVIAGNKAGAMAYDWMTDPTLVKMTMKQTGDSLDVEHKIPKLEAIRYLKMPRSDNKLIDMKIPGGYIANKTVWTKKKSFFMGLGVESLDNHFLVMSGYRASIENQTAYRDIDEGTIDALFKNKNIEMLWHVKKFNKASEFRKVPLVNRTKSTAFNNNYIQAPLTDTFWWFNNAIVNVDKNNPVQKIILSTLKDNNEYKEVLDFSKFYKNQVGDGKEYPLQHKSIGIYSDYTNIEFKRSNNNVSFENTINFYVLPDFSKHQKWVEKDARVYKGKDYNELQLEFKTSTNWKEVSEFGLRMVLRYPLNGKMHITEPITLDNLPMKSGIVVNSYLLPKDVDVNHIQVLLYNDVLEEYAKQSAKGIYRTLSIATRDVYSRGKNAGLPLISLSLKNIKETKKSLLTLIDTDKDGLSDNFDAFPNNKEYQFDSDKDGMPDKWEDKYGFNMYDDADAVKDKDNDGLSNLQEYNDGVNSTNPQNEDSDGDGYLDGEEVTAGSNPNDKNDYPNNTPPTANAGKDKKNVSIDAEVHLSGKDSNDTEGDPLTYLWSFVSKPNASSATLSDATIVNPTFTADENGTYTIQLIVNDGFSNSSPDTVVIETDEEAPVKEVNPTSCTPEFD